MPTNRKRIVRGKPKSNCHPCTWHSLIDNRLPPEHPDFNPFLLHPNKGKWSEYRAEVLAYWIEKYPGTRPSRFWIFEVTPPRPQTEKAKFAYLKKHKLLTQYERATLNNEAKNGS